MGLRYSSLSKALCERIEADRAAHWVNPYRCPDEAAVRRNGGRDKPNLWRPAFVRDVEKIMHLPLYNRYADKTQVFSFYQNDDITRRALHVQLVSRIARNIGVVLGLNLDLIEAIALGHDIGHTPFGHAGERFLNELYHTHTGRYFNHNVHSVRVLDVLFARNISLQTLDGILCHNGELPCKAYQPQPYNTFERLTQEVEDCYAQGASAIKRLVPATLEGCVVRVCDMIAYLGKDRQDAQVAKIIDSTQLFTTEMIGKENAAIINNLTVDIIENSYGKNAICLSDGSYRDLITAKDENYKVIYKNKRVNDAYEQIIRPMFEEVYEQLRKDLLAGEEASLIYRHHVAFIQEQLKYYQTFTYLDEEPDQIVVDYIASMTDDYFIALHKKLFPRSAHRIAYHTYFEEES